MTCSKYLAEKNKPPMADSAVILLISNSEKRVWNHQNLDIPADLLEGAENYLSEFWLQHFPSPLFQKTPSFCWVVSRNGCACKSTHLPRKSHQNNGLPYCMIKIPFSNIIVNLSEIPSIFSKNPTKSMGKWYIDLLIYLKCR